MTKEKALFGTWAKSFMQKYEDWVKYYIHSSSEKSVNSLIQIQTGLVNLSRSQAANSYCDQENHVGNNLKGTDGIILQPQKVGKSARVIGKDPVVDIIPLGNRKLNSKY